MDSLLRSVHARLIEGLVGLLAAFVVLSGLAGLPAAHADDQVPADGEAGILTEEIATTDTSNVAGWWRPLAEHDDATYLAFNAPAEDEIRHRVDLAKRLSDGSLVTDCLKLDSGDCAEYVDDGGHNQPTIAVDGNGVIHAFVSMHNDPWNYFRSSTAADVGTMFEQPSALPDAEFRFTYPVAATAPNGDVYLMARAYDPVTEDFSARLYRWDVEDASWSRVAIFAKEDGQTPYPDDLKVDPTGTVHLLWEWADGPPSANRYHGSYLTHDPETGEFSDVAGEVLTVPVSRTSAAVAYETRAGVVQTARMALAEGGTELVGVAYRYQESSTSGFAVRWAQWDGTAWESTEIASGFVTPASVGATQHGSTVRVYYVKVPGCTDARDREFGGLHVAQASLTDDGAGPWTEHWLGGGADVDRFAVEPRTDGTDVFYLAAPRSGNPVLSPALRYGEWDGTAPDDDPVLGGSVADPDNLAYGATVTTSSVREDFAGECAVDGNHWGSPSRWVSETTDTSPVIQLDFADAVSLQEVQVYSVYRSAAISSYELEAQVDGDWTVVATITDNTFSPRATVLAEPVVATGLRLRSTSGPTGIYEIKAYSTPVTAPVGATPISREDGAVQYAGMKRRVETTLVNLSTERVTGWLSLDAPAGWRVTPGRVSYDLEVGETRRIYIWVTVGAHEVGPVTRTVQLTTPAGVRVASFDIQLRSGIIYPSDDAPLYEESGTWFASSVLGHGDSPTRWATGGSGAVATWSTPTPSPGRYRVSVWIPPGDSTVAARYEIDHKDGTEVVLVDQLAGGGSWVDLGEWEFSDEASVRLIASAEGYHRSNAMRLQPV